MASEVTVAALGGDQLEAWARLVEGSPDGSVYALPSYLEALCRAGGGRWRALGVRLGEELVGGVTLYERDSRRGPYVMPRPLLYYNGPVLRRFEGKYPSEQTGRQLKVLGALAASLGGARTVLRLRSSLADVRPFLAAGWTAAPGYSYVVAVSDPKRTRARVEQNLRRLVRRSEAEGVAVTEDDDFTSFFRLHAGLVERKAIGLYLPEAAFRRFFEELRAAGLARLYHARLPGGRAVESQLVLLGPGGVAHAAAAAGDPAHHRTGAAALLRLRAFDALSALGYAGVDLTDAALNPVSHFKSQLGGELQLHLVVSSPRRWNDRLADGAARVLAWPRGLVRRGKAAP